jgi:hypothetical protein
MDSSNFSKSSQDNQVLYTVAEYEDALQTVTDVDSLLSRWPKRSSVIDCYREQNLSPEYMRKDLKFWIEVDRETSTPAPKTATREKSLSEMEPDSEQLIGQPLDPRYKVCGFSPSRVIFRDKTIKRKDGKLLSPFQKTLYKQMCEWCGKNGKCWYKAERMAKELGTSLSTIKHGLEVLCYVKLFKSDRHGSYSIYTPLHHKVHLREVQKSALGEAQASDSERGKKCKSMHEEVQDHARREVQKTPQTSIPSTKSTINGNTELLKKEKRSERKLELEGIREKIREFCSESIVATRGNGTIKTTELYSRFCEYYYGKKLPTLMSSWEEYSRRHRGISPEWFGRCIKKLYPEVIAMHTFRTVEGVYPPRSYLGITWREQ